MADEKKTNDDWKSKCAFTNASIKRARRYYRNGKYYKNKTAFLAAQKKAAQEAADAAQAAQAEAGESS